MPLEHLFIANKTKIIALLEIFFNIFKFRYLINVFDIRSRDVIDYI